MKILLVGFGGFLGAVARFALYRTLPPECSSALATLVVNLLGCFALGLLTGMLTRDSHQSEVALFWVTGFLGAFTTFSAFSIDNLRMLEAGQPMWAFLNASGQVLSGLLAVWVGRVIAGGVAGTPQ